MSSLKEFENRPSALLVHEEFTHAEASQICEAYNETLLDCASLPSYVQVALSDVLY